MAAILFLTQLHQLVAVVEAIIVAEVELPEEVAAVAAAADHITLVVVVEVLELKVVMQQCHQILEVNTALELPGRDILEVEAAATFTLRARAVAD
jgi:hypothetical protein